MTNILPRYSRNFKFRSRNLESRYFAPTVIVLDAEEIVRPERGVHLQLSRRLWLGRQEVNRADIINIQLEPASDGLVGGLLSPTVMQKQVSK